MGNGSVLSSLKGRISSDVHYSEWGMWSFQGGIYTIAIDAKSNIVPEFHMNKATAKDDRGMHR